MSEQGWASRLAGPGPDLSLLPANSVALGKFCNGSGAWRRVSPGKRGTDSCPAGLWITEGPDVHRVRADGSDTLPGALNLGSRSVLVAAFGGGDSDDSHFADEHTEAQGAYATCLVTSSREPGVLDSQPSSALGSPRSGRAQSVYVMRWRVKGVWLGARSTEGNQ